MQSHPQEQVLPFGTLEHHQPLFGQNAQVSPLARPEKDKFSRPCSRQHIPSPPTTVARPGLGSETIGRCAPLSPHER